MMSSITEEPVIHCQLKGVLLNSSSLRVEMPRL